jgi:hydroxyacylglutathione hydrolase
LTDLLSLAGGSLHVSQSRIYQTNAGVFVREGEAYAVDPSVFPDEIDALAQHIAALGARLRGIILTHSHWDHILGPERMPDGPVIAHESTAEHTEVSRLVEQRLAANGAPRDTPFVPPQINVMVGERLMLPFPKGSLRLYHAPGHCADQLVVYESFERTLWAADMLSDIEIPFADDVQAYRQTLERIMTLDIAVLIPGHGAPTSDSAEIKHRITSDHTYLVDLESAVTEQVRLGATLEQTRQMLGELTLRNSEANAREHLHNIETAYQALTR